MWCFSVRDPGVKLRLLSAGSGPGYAADRAVQISITIATVC